MAWVLDDQAHWVDKDNAQGELVWKGLRDMADRVGLLLDELVPEGRLPDHPLLISGDWGTGKTTLLKGIQAVVDQRWVDQQEVSQARRTVWFDAWKHEGEGSLLPGLVRAVWEGLPDDVRREKQAQGWMRRALELAAVAGLRVLPFATTALGLPLLGEVLKGLGTKALAEDTEAVESKESAEPPPDATTALREQLRLLLERGWPPPRREDQRRLFPVVIIDDLDRCSPSQAVGLLDQVRALLAAGGSLPCHFVVAMDRDVLTQAVSAKFTGLGTYDGNRYLEKMFPLAFAVPAPTESEAAKLVRACFDRLSPPSTTVTTPVAPASLYVSLAKACSAPSGRPAAAHELRADDLHLLTETLMERVFANPRLMKRCLNRYLLLRSYEQQDQVDTATGSDNPGARPGEADNRSLVRFIAAAERWPVLRRLVTLYDDRWWETLGEVVLGKRGEAPGPEGRFLLEQRGAREWLGREVYAGSALGIQPFRKAERRLARWGL